MSKFDYLFLNNGFLPANLVNLTSNIASLKTMAGVRKEEYQAVFTQLEAVLGAMVKNGSISRIGQGRSTRYIKT